MLLRGTGEVAAEVVAIDELHLAEVTSSQLPDSRAIEGDPGDLADVEAQRNRGVGVAPWSYAARLPRSQSPFLK